MSFALKSHSLSKSSRRTSSAGVGFKSSLATNQGVQLFAQQTAANNGELGLLVTRWKLGELGSVPIFGRDCILRCVSTLLKDRVCVCNGSTLRGSGVDNGISCSLSCCGLKSPEPATRPCALHSSVR